MLSEVRCCLVYAVALTKRGKEFIIVEMEAGDAKTNRRMRNDRRAFKKIINNSLSSESVLRRKMIKLKREEIVGNNRENYYRNVD